MAKSPAIDPRTAATPDDAAAAGEAGVRPIVRVPRAGVPGWAIGVGAVAAGILLFTVLDARRREANAPAPSCGPPISLPCRRRRRRSTCRPPCRDGRADRPGARAAPPPARAAAAAADRLRAAARCRCRAAPPRPPPPPPRVANAPALVFDGAPPAAEGAAAGGRGRSGGAGRRRGTAVAGTRTRAGVLANRATTVAQGTLIPAVLETALDSTRPGLARAIVSRDVRGFDGSRVLIPRGSRLIGEYRSRGRARPEAAPWSTGSG